MLGMMWALMAASVEAPPVVRRREEKDDGPAPWERPSLDAEQRDIKARTQLPSHGPSAKTLRRRAKWAAMAKKEEVSNG